MQVRWLCFILTKTCHFSGGSKLPVQDYRLIGDMRFLNLFFLLTRYVTCSFIPPKIKLWRTSCCQILAIYGIVKGDYPPRSRSLALTPTCLLVPSRQGWAGETLGTRMDGHVVIMMSTYVRVSLRSKRFCLVSEQRKSEERDFRFWPSQKWNESQKMKEGGGFLPLLPTLSPLTRAALKHTTQQQPSSQPVIKPPLSAAFRWNVSWSYQRVLPHFSLQITYQNVSTVSIAAEKFVCM